MSGSPLPVGTTLAGHYVLASLAQVSNAPQAWCASMVGSEQPVMVLYYPTGYLGPRALQRIVTEGADLRELRHPRLGAVLDLAAEPQGGVFAVTPWYGDDTLARRVERQGAFNLHVAGAIVFDVLVALGVLHGRGIAHRAVHPADVTLFVGADGRLRARLLPGGQLAEFGREGVLREGPDARPDPVGGEFAAPEQWSGNSATMESDVWASAVLFHLLATGVMPFAGSDASSRVASARSGSLTLAEALPPSVAAVLRRAIDPRPGGRFTDADSLRIALEAALSDATPLGAPVASKTVVAKATARPPAPTDSDDFDLDALVADVSRRSSAAPPTVGSLRPNPVAVAPTAPPPGGSERPALKDSLRPPEAPKPAPATQIGGFDLDSLGPPPMGKVAPPPAAKALVPTLPEPEPEMPWRESAVHTALEAKSIDRTHVVRAKRPKGLSVAAAVVGILVVGGGGGYLGWESMMKPPPIPRVEPVRALEPEPLRPAVAAGDDGGAAGDAAAPAWAAQSEVQTTVEFGEQFHMALPAGLDATQAQAFVSHLTTATPSSGPRTRGFVSCVEGRVFLHRGGVSAPLVEARVPARCESQDVALVPDLDSDGAADAVVVDSRRGALLLVGSARGSLIRRISLPGAWGLTGPLTLQVRGRPEPAVVAFVSSESGAPTLLAVGLQSGRVAWRLPAALRPAEPRDFGLVTIGDVDGDIVEDVAAGMLRDGRRCVMMLSGATGTPRWESPYCLPGTATQTLGAGPDLDDDGAADLLVSSAADGRMRLVSGRTGREIHAVGPTGTEPTTNFGVGAVYTADLAHDGYPDIGVVRATAPDATLEVYSANDDHRLGRFALHGAAGAVVEASRVRVQYARDFLYDGSISLVVASPVGIFLVGAAPRPEGV